MHPLTNHISLAEQATPQISAAPSRWEGARRQITIWHRWLLLPLLVMLLSLALERVEIDLSAVFFDRSLGQFPWRDHWLTRGVIHQFGRLPAALVFLCVLVLALRSGDALARARYRLALVSMLSCVLVVSALKLVSNTACAWDLQAFGGAYPAQSWFEALPPGLAAGHCWPGAFSLSGFVFFACYFLCHGFGAVRAERWVFWATMLYANALGFVQVMRGAHTLTHQIWTGLICWYVCLIGYWLTERMCTKNARPVAPAQRVAKSTKIG